MICQCIWRSQRGGLPGISKRALRCKVACATRDHALPQQGRLIAGSQKRGPTVGGLMYCELGSLAPSALFSAGPPGMPGSPRPAPPNGVDWPCRPPAASWLVVEGVSTFAGSPLDGAEDGWIGEMVTGDWACGFGAKLFGSVWAETIDTITNVIKMIARKLCARRITSASYCISRVYGQPCNPSPTHRG